MGRTSVVSASVEDGRSVASSDTARLWSIQVLVALSCRFLVIVGIGCMPSLQGSVFAGSVPAVLSENLSLTVAVVGIGLPHAVLCNGVAFAGSLSSATIGSPPGAASLGLCGYIRIS
ncbi:unnamed protein product [Umbelopsis ramanniana]